MEISVPSRDGNSQIGLTDLHTSPIGIPGLIKSGLMHPFLSKYSSPIKQILKQIPSLVHTITATPAVYTSANSIPSNNQERKEIHEVRKDPSSGRDSSARIHAPVFVTSPKPFSEPRVRVHFTFYTSLAGRKASKYPNINEHDCGWETHYLYKVRASLLRFPYLGWKDAFCGWIPLIGLVMGRGSGCSQAIAEVLYTPGD